MKKPDGTRTSWNHITWHEFHTDDRVLAFRFRQLEVPRSDVPLALQDLASSYPLDDPAATLAAVGESVGRAAGGTSGGLYHVLFVAAAASLARCLPRAGVCAIRHSAACQCARLARA